ncbi:hypothetical protein BH18GEM1_BH18GEM1_14400 [soil metagenome]
MPGRIQVTEAVYERLKEDYVLEPRGEIEVKGRGPMRTWWLVGRRGVGAIGVAAWTGQAAPGSPGAAAGHGAA